jgi:glutathione-regulated potassium-efflux system protein KefB
MVSAQLIQVAVFLAAAAIAAPLGRILGMGAVLGYLAAGVVIGPYILGPLYQLDSVESILHFGEFGVVMLLFVIGLELRPVRLWSMRSAIFGLGTAQLVATSLVLAAIGLALGLGLGQALFIGLALSLSSTAFALQILDEKGEINTRHGRLAFSVLLFQDLAAIPLIALVPLFAAGGGGEPAMDLRAGIFAILTIIAVIVVGRLLLNRLYRLVAATGVREAMTASALLTVVGVALVMEAAGLRRRSDRSSPARCSPFRISPSDRSRYRPVRGCCSRCSSSPSACRSIERRGGRAAEPDRHRRRSCRHQGSHSLCAWPLVGIETTARRLGLVISQGGEFAFVLFAAGVAQHVIGQHLANLLTLAVTLSMAATPVLLLADEMFRRRAGPETPDYEMPPGGDDHVIIAGFGRFGQIVARILRARQIPFTALDSSVEQVDFVKSFGSRIYYGDAGRIDILRAAETQKARAFVLAVNNVEGSLRIAETVRQNFPDVPIYARARDRTHVHRLMDLGVTIIERETFLSALELTRKLLRGLGLGEAQVKRLTETFKRLDEKRLYQDYQYYTDLEKVRANALSQAKELEELFARDVEELKLPEEEPAFVGAERRDGRRSSGLPRKDG